jgi:hypothetical protein
VEVPQTAESETAESGSVGSAAVDPAPAHASEGPAPTAATSAAAEITDSAPPARSLAVTIVDAVPRVPPPPPLLATSSMDSLQFSVSDDDISSPEGVSVPTPLLEGSHVLLPLVTAPDSAHRVTNANFVAVADRTTELQSDPIAAAAEQANDPEAAPVEGAQRFSPAHSSSNQAEDTAPMDVVEGIPTSIVDSTSVPTESNTEPQAGPASAGSMDTVHSTVDVAPLSEAKQGGQSEATV